MKKIVNNCLFLLLIVSLISCGSHQKKLDRINDDIDYANFGNYIKSNKVIQKFVPDLIPNEETAIKLADLIWEARYKTTKNMHVLPYSVKLENDTIWYVKTNLANGFMGEVFHVKINKYDGKILYVWSEG